MDTIKDIIPKVIAPLSAGRDSPAALWSKIVGTQGSAAADFRQGTLTVHVDCAARMVRLEQHKAQYLTELSKKNPSIQQLRFKVGKVPAQS